MPATSGLGSGEPTTTRAMPLSMMASVHTWSLRAHLPSRSPALRALRAAHHSARASPRRECARHARSQRRPSDLARSSRSRAQRAPAPVSYIPDRSLGSPHKKCPERCTFRANEKLLYKKKIWNAKHSRASPREEIFLACSSSSIQTILSAPESHRIIPFGSRALPPVGNHTLP